MTTTTINANTTNYAEVQSESDPYSAARAGSGSLSTITSSIVVGQDGFTNDYLCYLLYLDFDTSAIPAGSIINSVTLKLCPSFDGSSTDFTLQARSFDFGTSVTTADYRPGATFATDPLLATLTTAGLTTGSYKSFSENGTTFRSNVVSGGHTRIVIGSSRFANGNTPTGQESVQFKLPTDASFPPQLVIDYTANLSHTITPTSVASAESFGTATLIPGGVSLTPTSIASAESFGTATLRSVYSLSPVSIASAESFGAALIESGVTHVAPLSIASGEVFGTAVITPGGVTLTPTSIQSSESFGTAILTTLSTLLASEINSGEVFGRAVLTPGVITLTPAAIASAEAFGTAVLDTASRVFPAAIPSAESFGATRINTSVSLFPVSIASGESFGVAKLGFRIHIRHGVDMWVFVKEPTLLMDLWLMEEDE